MFCEKRNTKGNSGSAKQVPQMILRRSLLQDYSSGNDPSNLLSLGYRIRYESGNFHLSSAV